FSTTVPSSQYKGLEKYFIQEGLAYRVVPVTTDPPAMGEFGMIDHHIMYDNMMNRFKWGNAEDPSVYLDETNRRMFSNFRRIFGNLGKSLLQNGDTIKAVEVAHRGLDLVPADKMPHEFFTIGLAEVLIRAGKTDEGLALLNDIILYAKEYLDYAITIGGSRFGLDYSIGINMQSLIDIYNLSAGLGLESIILSLEPELNNYYTRLYSAK
ncbi:MAG TPA: tetratricopeptide repeat protein, partial [Bacteroidales bacterium]|nr:tetratricopeptide repeat protein [Bacteroidales bacterium]